MNQTQKLVYSMLMENTGEAMMDSGGIYGRNWQQNAKRDITKDPEVSLDYTAPCKSDDVGISVSLYHYLPTVLTLDELCQDFNKKFKKMADWDSEVYGVSTKALEWLKNRGFEVGDTWNSYNGENNLSQVLQGTELKHAGLGQGDYVLLQVHGGCDTRGGYTDAKLFKYEEFQGMIDPVPRVTAQITRENGETLDLDMRESGYGFELATDKGYGGEAVDILEGDKVEAWL